MGYDSLPFTVVVEDVNNDDLLDLVIANYGTNNLGVFLSSDNGTFRSPIIYFTGSSSSIFVGVRDFNKDVRVDIIIVNNDTSSMSVLLGYNEGLSAPTTYSTGVCPTSVIVADLNKDTNLDIVITL